MCSDKCPKPEEGCKPSESKGCCESSKSEGCYQLPSGGCVKFCQRPALQPLQLVTRNWHVLDACKRRRWKMADSWCVVLCGMQNKQRKVPNGEIVIPKGTVVDGASVPLPWLVSFLSFGMLRPNGILLIPSIVHDYAYKEGRLSSQGKGGGTKISRHDADWLFREMIQGINHTWFWAFIAWLAVRLGWWFGVKYNRRCGGGKVPFVELVVFLLMLSGLVGLLWWANCVAARCWGDFPWWVVILAGVLAATNLITSLVSRRKDVL